ncbi:RNA polymerase sigma-70 factor [Pedobacter metabolipauper]|uniref:RNA polymerase sigma-70 factor (ECF subfamily) n=1 Tax=Pedobacter metabolipauper TaxID=425513 RepID=A0A4R6SXU1_9SPHI|nr:RNA polymerase sigma-70 factor [Pedobacter metabolipauper]TDQ10269.1 RNA polymerase sigma-70 factor (ECF subfamily) [Pedobacter metabolipauper]
MKVNEYKNLSDAELCELLSTSDTLAFTELMTRYERLIYNHATNILRDTDQARDVVQELFIWVWDNHKVLTYNLNFASFLYSSIRNKIIDLIRHEKVKVKYLNTLPDFMKTGVAETDHLIRAKNFQSIIERELSAMPEKMRQVFEMSRNQNLSNKEIAEKLDISQRTVEGHITNALKMLRKNLGLFKYLIFIIFY